MWLSLIASLAALGGVPAGAQEIWGLQTGPHILGPLDPQVKSGLLGSQGNVNEWQKAADELSWDIGVLQRENEDRPYPNHDSVLLRLYTKPASEERREATFGLFAVSDGHGPAGDKTSSAALASIAKKGDELLNDYDAFEAVVSAYLANVRASERPAHELRENSARDVAGRFETPTFLPDDKFRKWPQSEAFGLLPHDVQAVLGRLRGGAPLLGFFTEPEEWKKPLTLREARIQVIEMYVRTLFRDAQLAAQPIKRAGATLLVVLWDVSTRLVHIYSAGDSLAYIVDYKGRRLTQASAMHAAEDPREQARLRALLNEWFGTPPSRMLQLEEEEDIVVQWRHVKSKMSAQLPNGWRGSSPIKAHIPAATHPGAPAPSSAEAAAPEGSLEGIANTVGEATPIAHRAKAAHIPDQVRSIKSEMTFHMYASTLGFMSFAYLDNHQPTRGLSHFDEHKPSFRVPHPEGRAYDITGDTSKEGTDDAHVGPHIVEERSKTFVDELPEPGTIGPTATIVLVTDGVINPIRQHVANRIYTTRVVECRNDVAVRRKGMRAALGNGVTKMGKGCLFDPVYAYHDWKLNSSMAFSSNYDEAYGKFSAAVDVEVGKELFRILEYGQRRAQKLGEQFTASDMAEELVMRAKRLDRVNPFFRYDDDMSALVVSRSTAPARRGG